MQHFSLADSSVGKESVCNAGDPGSIPEWGRPPGEGNGYPLQYSGLENSRNCIVLGVAKSRTRLSDLPFLSLLPPAERAVNGTLHHEEWRRREGCFWLVSQILIESHIATVFISLLLSPNNVPNGKS